MADESDVTLMLQQATDGDRGAVDVLAPIVYDELRRLAQHQLQSERPDHTLQATALAHEAYLRLIDQTRVQWKSRAHFLAIAAQAIRRILIDHARSRHRSKRMGDRQRVPLDERAMSADGDITDVLTLDEALRELAAQHPDKAAVVELRYFGGLTYDEIAEVAGVTARTAERRWQFARAWLYRRMSPEPNA